MKTINYKSAKLYILSCMVSILMLSGFVMKQANAVTLTKAEETVLKKLSADWWASAMSIPLAQNPLADTTGSQCVLKKQGKTWLLASTFEGKEFVTRNCIVPAGTSIFLPVISEMNFNSPGFCGQTDAQGNVINFTVADIRKKISEPLNKAINLTALLDYYTPLQIWRVESNAFKVTVPNGNLFDPICEKSNLSKVPVGTYSPALADGYWLKVDPLPVGEHHLHTHGEIVYVIDPIAGFPGQDIMHDIVYEIEVTP